MSSIPKFSTRYWTFYQHQKCNLSQTELTSPGEWGGCVSFPYPSVNGTSIHPLIHARKAKHNPPQVIFNCWHTIYPMSYYQIWANTTSKYLRNLFSNAVFSFVPIKSYSAQSTPHLRNPSLVVRWLAMLWSCHSCADLCFCTYVIILHLHLPPSYIKIH